MKLARTLLLACLALGTSLSGVSSGAQPPDNSAQNKSQAPTADNQPNHKTDLMLARQARKAVIADKDLSTYAHNIKIIAVNGSVTLKGPVRSDDEKQKVASDVASVVSTDKITNELTVKQ